MSNLLAVRITTGNRLFQFRSDPYVVSLGDHVLIQVQGELHMGRVERITPVAALAKTIADPAFHKDQVVSGPDVRDTLNSADVSTGETINDGLADETGAQRHMERALIPETGQRGVPVPEAPSGVQTGLPAIFRPATEEDLIRDRENRELARKAHAYCRECIVERGLDMKLVEVEVLFDGSKMIFYFTAPNRIDFRELVKDLVRSFRTRIELRQIGARHETQMLGGLGNCGQLVCCQRFLRQFAPSTIKMAKEQNLFLNPAKISGVCNRLLCCLSYEQPNYDEFLNQCPKIGKRFSTSLGSAKVIRANYFRRSLSIFMEPGGEKEVDLEEWRRLISTPKESAELERRLSRPRIDSQEGGSPQPAPTSLAAEQPALAESIGLQIESPQVSREEECAEAPAPLRKKSKRAGRKARSGPGAVAFIEIKADHGKPPETGPVPSADDSVPGGKPKRRSRASRRKSKKQRGFAKEQS